MTKESPISLFEMTTKHVSITVPATLNYGTIPISMDVPRILGFCPSVDVRIGFGATVADSKPTSTSAIIPAGSITRVEIPRLTGHLGFIPVSTTAGTVSIYGMTGSATTSIL